MSFTSDSLLTALDFAPLTFTPGTPDSGEYLATAAPKISNNFNALFAGAPISPQRMFWFAKLSQQNALWLQNHAGTVLGAGTAGVNGRGDYTNNLSKRLYRHYDTGTTAQANAGIRAGSSADHGARGSDAGVGGFVFKHRIGLVTVPASSFRLFTGALANGSEPSATADPSSYVNCVGLGKDAADTSLSIMVNDGSGTCTKVALDVGSFPISAGSIYELVVACAPGSAQNVSYRVQMITGVDADGNDTFGASTSGSLTTNLPAADTFMNAGLSLINNAANASNFVMAFLSQTGIRL